MQKDVMARACLIALAIAPVAAAAQTPTPNAMSGMPMSGTMAMPTCKATDPVVWVNTKSKVFYVHGASMYGKTVHGKYACESAAVAGGAHLVKMPSGVSGSSMGSMGHSTTGTASAASPMPTGSGIETNQVPNGSSTSSPAPP